MAGRCDAGALNGQRPRADLSGKLISIEYPQFFDIVFERPPPASAANQQ
jgi:hypothetical protein